MARIRIQRHTLCRNGGFYFMKTTLSILAGVCAACFLSGCDRSANDRSANETSDTSVTASRSNSTGLSPTARDTNGSSRAYSGEANPSGSFKDADNTGRNTRDRSSATLTPGDQGSSDSDRDITRQIRRALTTNDQFSTTAKNIKIITLNGKVTLRGPVNNEQEKQAIVSSAQSAAGSGTVDDQLEVKANQ